MTHQTIFVSVRDRRRDKKENLSRDGGREESDELFFSDQLFGLALFVLASERI